MILCIRNSGSRNPAGTGGKPGPSGMPQELLEEPDQDSWKPPGISRRMRSVRLSPRPYAAPIVVLSAMMTSAEVVAFAAVVTSDVASRQAVLVQCTAYTMCSTLARPSNPVEVVKLSEGSPRACTTTVEFFDQPFDDIRHRFGAVIVAQIFPFLFCLKEQKIEGHFCDDEVSARKLEDGCRSSVSQRWTEEQMDVGGASGPVVQRAHFPGIGTALQ